MMARRSPFNAEKLRTFRKILGLTQRELAERTGVDRNTISRIELGHFCPRPDLARRIAEVLDVEVESLYITRSGDLAALGRKAGALSGVEEQVLAAVRRMRNDAGRAAVLAFARGLADTADVQAAFTAAQVVHDLYQGKEPPSDGDEGAGPRSAPGPAEQ